MILLITFLTLIVFIPNRIEIVRLTKTLCERNPTPVASVNGCQSCDRVTARNQHATRTPSTSK